MRLEMTTRSIPSPSPQVPLPFPNVAKSTSVYITHLPEIVSSPSPRETRRRQFEEKLEKEEVEAREEAEETNSRTTVTMPKYPRVSGTKGAEEKKRGDDSNHIIKSQFKWKIFKLRV